MSNSNVSTRVLFPQTDAEKKKIPLIPSDSIKAQITLNVAITPEQLKKVSKGTGNYESGILNVIIAGIQLDTANHNFASWVHKALLPFKGTGLFIFNDCVKDANKLGEFLIDSREPEPAKEKPTKASKSVDSGIALSFDDIGENDASAESVKVQDSRFDLVKNYHAPKARQAKLDAWNQFLVDNWGNSATKYKDIFHSEFFKDVTHDYEYMLSRIGDKCKVAPFSEDVYKGLLIEVQAHN